MKKQIIILLLFFLVSGLCAQNDSVKFESLWNVRVSFAMQESHISYKGPLVNYIPQGVSFFEPHTSLDFDYRINDFSVGAYLGYTRYYWYTRDLYDKFSRGDHALNYGMNVRYYLPILTSLKWFDFYMLGKIGGVRLFLDPVAEFKENKYGEMEPLSKDFKLTLNDRFEVGAGLGVSFYLLKQFGMFGEFAVGQFYTSHYNWRVGFLVRI